MATACASTVAPPAPEVWAAGQRRTVILTAKDGSPTGQTKRAGTWGTKSLSIQTLPLWAKTAIKLQRLKLPMATRNYQNRTNHASHYFIIKRFTQSHRQLHDFQLSSKPSNSICIASLCCAS